MKRKMLIGACLFWLSVGGVAEASVRINEIAWMGTVVSSSNEWLELYNDGENAVDLFGWDIVASDGSPHIMLSGVIASHGYFLIERSDDNAVSGVLADLVALFGNGLSNMGETLRLLNNTGAVVDEVIGGKNWTHIGGDAATKETAQRTMNSWITGRPTPRFENVSAGEVAGVATESNTMGTSVLNQEVTTKINEEILGQSVYVGVPISFSQKTVDKNGNILLDASYRWNFGDGAVGSGSSVTHTYQYAGEYMLTLEVFWNGMKNTDRMTVRVGDPAVAIAGVKTGKDGFVELKNLATHELDISGWVIRIAEGGSTFAFPTHSIILPNKSVRYYTMNTALVVLSGQTVVLFQPNNTRAAIFATPKVASPSRTPMKVGAIMATTSAKTVASFATTVAANHVAGIVLSATSTGGGEAKIEQQGSDTAAAAVLWEHERATYGNGVGSLPLGFSGRLQWSFVVLGIVFIALAGFIIARSRIDEATAADEYAIIEDIIEGKDDLDKQFFRTGDGH